METYTITIERISTGESAPTFLVRRDTEAEARAYAEELVGHDADLRVGEIVGRKA